MLVGLPPLQTSDVGSSKLAGVGWVRPHLLPIPCINELGIELSTNWVPGQTAMLMSPSIGLQFGCASHIVIYPPPDLSAVMKGFCLTVTVALGAMLVTSCTFWGTESGQPVQEATASETPVSPATKLTTARQLAWDAAVLVQKPPHPVPIWQEARLKWRQAIQLLESIPPEDKVASQAGDRLSVYRKNYAAIDNRLTTEQQAVNHIQQAQTLAWQAAVTVQKPPHSIRVWQRARHKWQEAIALLEAIQPTTTVAAEAQTRLARYRQNRNVIVQRIEAATAATAMLRQFLQTASQLDKFAQNALAGDTAEVTGIGYEDYSNLVRELRSAVNSLTQLPYVDQQPSYPELTAALEDYEFALDLWQDYFSYKQQNAQWLYDDPFNQLVPITAFDSTTLMQRYNIRPFAGNNRVSLKFTLWGIWEQAMQRVRNAQQRVQALE